MLRSRDCVQYCVSDLVFANIRVAFNNRIGVQIVQSARPELIRTADLEQSPIAGFGGSIQLPWPPLDWSLLDGR